MPCVFHCLDFGLVSEWFNTSSEYLGYVKKPFQAVALRDLWKCKQSDWDAAFREWGVLQLYAGVATAILSAVIQVSRGGNFLTAGIDLVVRIIMSYLMAHLCWFSIVRKGGCICCLIACCEGTPILLLWGALAVAWGILALVSSLSYVTACAYCFIDAIFTAIYAVILLYMGICCLHIWKKKGAEIIPPAVEVKGPEGGVIGATQTA